MHLLSTILVISYILIVGCEEPSFIENANRFLKVGNTKQGRGVRLTELFVRYKPLKMVTFEDAIDDIVLEASLLFLLTTLISNIINVLFR